MICEKDEKRGQMTMDDKAHLYRPQGEEQSNASPNYKSSQYTSHHTALSQQTHSTQKTALSPFSKVRAQALEFRNTTGIHGGYTYSHHSANSFLLEEWMELDRDRDNARAEHCKLTAPKISTAQH